MVGSRFGGIHFVGRVCLTRPPLWPKQDDNSQVELHLCCASKESFHHSTLDGLYSKEHHIGLHIGNQCQVFHYYLFRQTKFHVINFDFPKINSTFAFSWNGEHSPVAVNNCMFTGFKFAKWSWGNIKAQVLIRASINKKSKRHVCNCRWDEISFLHTSEPINWRLVVVPHSLPHHQTDWVKFPWVVFSSWEFEKSTLSKCTA